MTTGEPEVDFLRRLQRHVLLSRGIDPEPWWNKAVASQLEDLRTRRTESRDPEERKTIEKLLHHADTALKGSGYQDPRTHFLMTYLSQRVTAASVSWGNKLPAEPLLATVASGSLNAMTVWVSGAKRPVIIFDEQMFRFTDAFGVALGRLFQPSEDEGLISHATELDAVISWTTEHWELVQDFWSLLFDFITENPYEVKLSRPSSDSLPASRLGEFLGVNMGLFVMGHEYGHVFAHHAAEASRSKLPMAKELNAELISWNHTQEQVADFLGTLMAVKSLLDEGHNAAMSIAGIDLLFGLFEIIDRSVSVLSTGEENRVRLSATHPAPAHRRRMLHQAVPEIIGHKGQAEDALKIGRDLRMTLELLWEYGARGLKQLHEEGVRPDARWQIGQVDASNNREVGSSL